MKSRKIKKAFFLTLVMMMALILLSVVFVNLPFAHRFITRSVNNILVNAHVPISIHSIETIWPNSVAVSGVNLHGNEGDTIMYAEKFGASVSLLGLLQRKVLIPSAFLSNSSISLLRQNADQQINMAEAFSSIQKEGRQKKEKNTVLAHQELPAGHPNKLSRLGV